MTIFFILCIYYSCFVCLSVVYLFVCFVSLSVLSVFFVNLPIDLLAPVSLLTQQVLNRRQWSMDDVERLLPMQAGRVVGVCASRTRVCTNPKYCPSGDTRETATCNTKTCPGEWMNAL